ncbi:MAG: helix-turn-helix domain-containing protein [Ruminococcaceae bacterium]|nr:helix-turn-helix domain-containing protein [Oscillospiraceae bacterium]
MINKIHFGKRISALRKRLNYSQADLAEKLNITPQAISKWECGATLPDIDLLLQLSHIYGVSINQMLEDNDLVFELTGKPVGKDGITYFVPEEESDYAKAWADEIVSEKWIERNWKNNCSYNNLGHEIVTITNHGGTILEIGAGPGGGFMPYILKSDPDSSIIISDISPTIVREWKALLDKELDSPNLYYAALDFCNMPFKDCSIDIVSDAGGIGNAIGDKAKALKEAYRVLKPGGLLITSTGFVNKETLAALPKDIQQVLIDKRPDIFEDLYEDTVLAGFGKIDSVISGHWYTDDDESGIADLARSLGVNLKFTSYTRYCKK